MAVNKYAEHYGLAINTVELRLEYQQSFDRCEEIDIYEHLVHMTVRFEGNLTEQKRDQQLYKISLHCPVHKMLHAESV